MKAAPSPRDRSQASGASARTPAAGAEARPRTAARVGDHNLLGVMAGYVPGVALESKLVSVFPDNDHRGLPSHQGLIALFDESSGAPIALMDGTHITAIRTGAP